MNTAIDFPVKIDAAEIEDGINAEDSFSLCIEIAKRYNCHAALLQVCMDTLDNIKSGAIFYPETIDQMRLNLITAINKTTS